MSRCFEIGVVARSPQEDIDLDSLLGHGFTLRVSHGSQSRCWTGIVAHAEQVEVETAGLSRYYFRLAPELFRATQRKNSRIFQHLSTPEIAVGLLAEWQIVPVLELDKHAFPRHEYKVQYGETDFAFLSRLLEEAGIAYYFRDPQKHDGKTELVLMDDPARGALRSNKPLPYVDAEHYPSISAIANVRLANEIRPGRYTVRDFDFRARPDVELLAQAKVADALESRLEIYEYQPGAFLVDPGGDARVDMREAKHVAERDLQGARQGRRHITYHTNSIDLSPGVIFSIADHPRRDLDKSRRLLVVGEHIQGSQSGDWHMTGDAVFADLPYRPARETPRPRIPGLQSALVTGPHGEEIFTDELGRVKVQFHWDREGKRDDKSSCFVRVSQSWAGAGHGQITIPRIGDEVLVGFFEGDPDQPVIVGRVYNGSARTPIKLPIEKTKSAWIGKSSPGGGGSNQIVLDDQKGVELVAITAERNMERTTKHDENVNVGANLSTKVGQNEKRDVQGDQTMTVAGSRSVTVSGSDTVTVGESFKLDIGCGAGAAIYKDKRIVLTTGEASIVIDGPNIHFDTKGSFSVTAGELISLSGGEVHIDGRPNVYLNSGESVAPVISGLAGLITGIEITPEDQVHEEKLEILLGSPVEEPGKAPEAMQPPTFVNHQLEVERAKIVTGIDQAIGKLKTRAEMLEEQLKKKIGQLKEDLVPRVEAARKEAYALIDSLRSKIEKVKAEAAARIAALEAHAKKIEADLRAIPAQIRAKFEEAQQRVQQAIQTIKDRIAEVKQRARDLVTQIKTAVTDLKAKAKTVFDDLRQLAIDIRTHPQDVIQRVKADIEQVRKDFKDFWGTLKTDIDDAKTSVKEMVDDAKQAVQDVKNEVKQTVTDLKQDAQDLKSEIKQDVQDIKDEAKAAVADAKKDVDDVKKVFGFKATGTGFGKSVGGIGFNPQAANGGNGNGQHAMGLAQRAGLVSGNGNGHAQLGQHALPGGAEQLAQHNNPGLLAQAQKGAEHANQGHTGLLEQAQHAHGNAMGHANQGQGLIAAGAGHASQTGNLLDQAKQGAANGNAAGSAIGKSNVVTRSGAFGGASVANAVNNTEGSTFLQSPNEGQLMIVRTQHAAALSGEDLTRHIVEKQMEGMSSDEAFAAALTERGYAVYSRPWDSAGEFVKVAVL